VSNPKTGKLLQQAQLWTEQALKLLDSETADAIIGEPTTEYQTLVQGMEGAYLMLWIMANNNGLRKVPAVERMGSQALIVMLSLLHSAYALGIRHGRENL